MLGLRVYCVQTVEETQSVVGSSLGMVCIWSGSVSVMRRIKRSNSQRFRSGKAQDSGGFVYAWCYQVPVSVC